MFQCGGGTIASAADSHTGASDADLIALEVWQTDRLRLRGSVPAEPVAASFLAGPGPFKVEFKFGSALPSPSLALFATPVESSLRLCIRSCTGQ